MRIENILYNITYILRFLIDSLTHVTHIAIIFLVLSQLFPKP